MMASSMLVSCLDYYLLVTGILTISCGDLLVSSSQLVKMIGSGGLTKSSSVNEPLVEENSCVGKEDPCSVNE